MTDKEFITNSPKETVELGKNVGQKLKGGEVFALSGDLGTGKTHFIKGAAVGAGVERESIVNSPTFVLVNEYEGRLMIYHIDAYRIEKLSDFINLGFEDFIDPANAVFIEWADKVADALEGLDVIKINFQHEGHNSRKITFHDVPEYIFA